LNPWLTHDASAKAKVIKKASEVVVGKDSKPAEKAKNKLKKVNQKLDEERERAKDDAVVDISLDNVLASVSTSTSAAPLTSGPQPAQQTKAVPQKNVPVQPSSGNADASDDSDDDNMELEAQELALKAKGKGKANGLKAFEQRDLVALAFAGDNVVQVYSTLVFSHIFVSAADLSLLFTRASRMPSNEKLWQMRHEK
jgi:U3 small nucleolar RNA-associated protein 14